ESLGELEYGISHKAVADDHVGYSVWNINYFGVSNEVYVGIFKHLIGFLNDHASLFLLHAYIGKADGRIFYSEHVLRVNGTHFSELLKILGFAVDISAAVKKKRKSFKSRQA